MFEVDYVEAPGGGEPPARTGAPKAAEVLAFATSLGGSFDGLDDAERIDLIRALEVAKGAAEGAQATVTVDFDTSQRTKAAARGVAPERQGRGIAHQLALARRESPHRGQRHLGLAKVLATEMPHTLAALREGRITEWKATLLARETACLSLEDRRRIDRELAGNAEGIEQMGDRELAGQASKRAAELDPESVAARRSKAEADRHVSVRPAPDTMTWLGAHLSVKHGVSVYAALKAEADRLILTGDGRSRGQIMADTLVARVLDPAITTTGAPAVPIRVNVVISLDSLLAETDDGAAIPGYGPIPAATVRDWIREGLAAGVQVELRRLFASPDTGQLVAMESGSRAFPATLAEFIELRDQRCRTPWCDAPIRHADHVQAAADGGPTSAANGQGLCESCNYAKEAIGWDAHPRPGPGHEVETVTPTGHTYLSRAGMAVPPTSQERRLADLIWAA
ncbi:MAG: DUF222 domain-containing protein [Nocardioides sp.]